MTLVAATLKVVLIVLLDHYVNVTLGTLAGDVKLSMTHAVTILASMGAHVPYQEMISYVLVQLIIVEIHAHFAWSLTVNVM